MIERWNSIPLEILESMDPEGDFSKRHLLYATVVRMLGDVAGQRILDAGCGQGYFARMLAARGASVVGVDAARSLYDYCVAVEYKQRQHIEYDQADLSEGVQLGAPFDAVVANMVLMTISDWRTALSNCVNALRPGGLLVFSITHPCFEGARESWLQTGYVTVREYLQDYETPGTYAVDFHRPLGVYLSAVAALGCRILDVAEPGLPPHLVATGPGGVEAYVHVPAFLVVAATRIAP